MVKGIVLFHLRSQLQLLRRLNEIFHFEVDSPKDFKDDTARFVWDEGPCFVDNCPLSDEVKLGPPID
jgi:hypothetical protein